MGLLKKEKNEGLDSLENYYVTIYGKKYAFDVNKIKEICIESSNDDDDSENEITTTYEKNDDGSLEISGKLIREVKTGNNTQNGMIVYDVIKLFIMRLLENTEVITRTTRPSIDFSTSLALNTLIKCGILVEIK